MNDPTVTLKLDENLGGSVLTCLREANLVCTTVAGEKLTAASDKDLIEVCRSERKCLVTLDLDFSDPWGFDPTNYYGIAVLRMPDKATLRNILEATETLVKGIQRYDITGKLWIVQRQRIREYTPEDSGSGA